MLTTVHQLCEAYEQWARVYYRKPSGRQTGAIYNILESLAALRQAADPEPPAGLLFRQDDHSIGDLPAADFSAKLLRHVQKQMIEAGLCRITINDRIGWIKRMFEWACGPDEERLPEHMIDRLRLVKPLKPGRSAAKEREPMRSVAYEHIEMTARYADEMIATMIWVQWYTGMRPGELCIMHRATIDRESDKDIWLYRPHEHKAQHYIRRRREVAFHRKAREALELWLPKITGDWIFPGRLKDQPIRRNSYYQAIADINRRYGLQNWCPKQIRKAFATWVARELSHEDARALLDHASLSTTERHYIDPDLQRKIDAMKRLS